MVYRKVGEDEGEGKKELCSREEEEEENTSNSGEPADLNTAETGTGELWWEWEVVGGGVVWEIYGRWCEGGALYK